MKKVVVATCLFCLSVTLFAAQSLKKLPELVAILREVHQIEVKDQFEGGVIISWPASESRKLDAESLEILKKVAGITEENERWYFHIVVFTKLQEGKSEGQVMSNSQYKASIMHSALEKLSMKGTVVESAGLGHEYNEDRIFLRISENARQPINKVVAQ